MSMATHLDNNMKLSADINVSLDKRWKKKDILTFLVLLEKFRKETKYDDFYESNTDLYAEVSRRFLPVYKHLDLDWYSAFYGTKPTEKFVIINGLGNGSSNYGPCINYKNEDREVYAIMGAWTTDSLGMPLFRINDYFPTLLHEFNHSFINHLTNKNIDAFAKNVNQISAVVDTEMSRQGYGGNIVISEAMVRAAVIKYMKDHDFDQTEIDNQMQEQIERAFIWMPELVSELDRYDQQRDLYPTLEDYMPNIIKAYDAYAQKVKRYESMRPKIVSIGEFKNGNPKVDASLKTITVNFDRPLLGKGYSVYLGSKGADAFPKIVKISYINGNKSVVMRVNLEKDKEYQCIMKGICFQSVEGVGIRDFEINFKTKK